MSTVQIGHIRTALRARFESLIDLTDLPAKLPTDERDNHLLTRSLSAFSVAELAGIDDRLAAATVVDGSKDNGIDGFYFDHQDHVCYLVQSKWNKNGKHSIELGEILKFIQGVRDLLEPRLDRFDKLQKKQQEVDTALSDTSAKFILLIAYTGEPAIAQPIKQALDDLLDDMNDVTDFLSYRVLRQAELHSIVAQKAQGHSIDFEIMLSEWGKIDEPYRAFYGQVALEEIAEWGKYGQSLYSRNLRGFKGSTDVNDAIINTMRQSPQNFWYFNNGITLLCNKVVKQHKGGSSRASGVFECGGASVVNGAQTVGSIIAASKNGENGFHHARVLVRLISLEGCPPTFDSDLTRAANTQNRIDKKDFAALDPTQARLRTDLFLEFGKEYAYRTGDPIPAPDDGCTLDEAATALACAQKDVALVVYAKAAPGRLYDEVTQPPYTALFNPSVSALKLWRSVEILRLVENILKTYQSQLEGKDRYIAIHGNRFVLHVIFQTIEHIDQASKDEFELKKKSIASATITILERVISAVKKIFPPTSYAGNLFKNISKCKEIVAEIGESSQQKDAT